MFSPPFFPIVYIRGYAGAQAEVEDTVATPYMGFNLGSTKLRQRWTGDIDRHIFESPLIRLMKDHGYTDIYEAGSELPRGKRAPAKSVWIYRYYEPVSKALGSGQRPEIEDYASGLHAFIERMRDQICGPQGSDDSQVQTARDAFKVYLVAHSMGGLVVRCYLQNVCKQKSISPPVDKVFTYATPHGGIDFRLIGNVPAFLKMNNVDNFNEKKIRDYLSLSDGAPVNSLDKAFDPDRFFCLVGTNRRDYEVAHGLSSFAVGPMSDGLVQIKNAYVLGTPRAFVHRSHSGHYGIVNSEEGYQNLRRFLFGRVRVDGFLDVDEISLPPKVQAAHDKGKKIRASYHIEVIARVRKERWDLHRRVVNEGSAIFVPFARFQQKRPIQLLSAYLLKDHGMQRRERLGFSLDLSVLVPEYEVDGFWFLDQHYEGGYLFRDKINLEVALGGTGPPSLRFGFDRKTPNRASRTAQMTELGDGQFEFVIPVQQKTRPGLTGNLVLRARPWN